MLHCKPKAATPCIRYDKDQKDRLIEFVLVHGSQLPHFEKNDVAHILTIVHGESRFVYLYPGSWLRCVGTCQFSASTHETFGQSFELVGMAGAISGINEETAGLLAGQMNAMRITKAETANVLSKALKAIRGKGK